MDDLRLAARTAIERCPHCGNEAGLELSQDLVYRCRICGGPRVPIVAARVERSGAEARLLKEAERAHRSAWLLRALWVVAGVTGGFAFALTFLTLLLLSALTSAWASLLAFAALPLGLAFWARQRSLKARRRRADALNDAWTSVAHELLVATPGELTSEQLAGFMLTNEARANQLLAQLNVDDRVRSRVTEDGQVVYSTRTPRLRISADPLDTELTGEVQTAEETRDHLK